MDSTTDCPSTHLDLIINCVLFLVPATATLCYVIWRHRVEEELVVAYTHQGSTLQARVIGKQATIVREFRGVADAYAVDSPREQDYEVAPFFLRVQYHTLGVPTAVAKRVEVKEPKYKRVTVGDAIELQFVPGYDRSAIVLSELHKAHGVSLVFFCAFLCLLAMGLCAISTCVTFGWTILIGIQLSSFLAVWMHLQHSRRDQVLGEFLNPPEQDTESQHLIGGNTV